MHLMTSNTSAIRRGESVETGTRQIVHVALGTSLILRPSIHPETEPELTASRSELRRPLCHV